MKFFLIHSIDVFRGDAVFIGDHRISQEYLGFREFAANRNKDNWLTPLKLDYKHEVKIVNKNHPKYKQIVKLINISLEHGIESRWRKLFKGGIMMFFYMLERLSDQDIVDQITSEIEKTRSQILFDELSNVFL